MTQALGLIKSPGMLLFLVAFVLSFTKLSLIAVGLVLFGWFWLAAQLFQKRFFLGYVTSFFVGLLAFYSFTSLIAMGFRLFEVPVPMPAIIGLNGATVLCWLVYLSKKKPAPHPGVRVHWTLIACIVAIVALFAAPIALRPNSSNLLHMSTFGFDDGAHIQMFRANILNQGYIAQVDKTNDPDLNIHEMVASYPQSMHFVLSVFARGAFALFNTTAHDVHGLLLTYRIGMALLYASLVVMLIEVMAQGVAYLRRTNQKLSAVSQLGIGATVLIVYATLIYPQIAFAGQTFLVNVALFAGTLLMLVMFLLNHPRPRNLFAMACLLAIGVASTWVISMIVVFVALALVALTQKTSQTTLMYLKTLYEQPRLFNINQFFADTWTWWFMAGALVLSLPQIFILLSASNSLDTFNYSGGIDIPDHTRYLMLTFILIASLVALLTSKLLAVDKKQFANICLLFLAPLTLMIAMYALQMVTRGEISYYFTKASYMAYIFIVALLGVVAVYLLARAEDALGKLRALYLTALVFSLLAVTVWMNRDFLHYTRGINKHVQTPVTREAGKLIDQGVRPRSIIAYRGLHYEEDMLFNVVTGLIDQHRLEQRYIIDVLAQQKRYGVMVEQLKEYVQRSETTYILASQKTATELKNALPLSGNYEIIIVE